MAAPASALRVSGLASTPRKWVSGGAPTLPCMHERCRTVAVVASDSAVIDNSYNEPIRIFPLSKRLRRIVFTSPTRRLRLAVRTQPSHGWCTGSIPVGVAIFSENHASRSLRSFISRAALRGVVWGGRPSSRREIPQAISSVNCRRSIPTREEGFFQRRRGPQIRFQ